MPSPRDIRTKRTRRAKRARVLVRGTADRPRLSVFRSNRHLAAQLIDDRAGKTLVSTSDLEMKASKKQPKNRSERAAWVGALVAERALAKGITTVRFDRGAYRYHGLVAALARAARDGGLTF